MLAAALMGMSGVTSYANTTTAWGDGKQIGSIINIDLGGFPQNSVLPQFNFNGGLQIGSTGDAWNPIFNSDVTIVKNLVDTVTNSTPVTLDYTGPDINFSYLAASSSGFNTLAGSAYLPNMRTFLYAAEVNTQSLVFTNLAHDQEYTFYAYSQGTKKSVLAEVGLKVNMNGATDSVIDNTGHTYLDHFVLGENYVKLVGKSDNTGKLAINYTPLFTTVGSAAGVFSAGQLTPTPEPASMLLIGVGGVLMSAMKARKKKALDNSIA